MYIYIYTKTIFAHIDTSTYLYSIICSTLFYIIWKSLYLIILAKELPCSTRFSYNTIRFLSEKQIDVLHDALHDGWLYLLTKNGILRSIARFLHVMYFVYNVYWATCLTIWSNWNFDATLIRLLYAACTLS